MLKYIKKIFVTAIKIFLELKLSVKIFLVVGIAALFSIVSIELTSLPAFCNSCHIMKPYYDNWKTSSHSEVTCLKCHLQPGLAGLIKGKINGLAQSVNCMVGRVGTKPNAIVTDASCLRTGCHNTEELVSTTTDFNGAKFTHKKHISKVVDGIAISCGTCHSHFEGDEHFEINSVTCFTCHFLKDNQNDERLVQTGCLSCHDVPNKVIKRGLVSINHAEFVSYKASCEDSCHKKQIEQESKVTDTICWNCHDFSREHEASSEELHRVHTTGEKVECFACHGNILHEASKSSSIAAMLDCRSCHSDTHSVQSSIYASKYHVQEKGKAERVLGPMFLTHVECTGCHTESMPQKSGALDSFGTVAKAVPEACDRCHKEGAGQRYISFWQKKTKELHKKVSDIVDTFERHIKSETDKEQILKMNAKVAEARAILESVSSDGSWGVHNFKYTETMLRRAGELINE